MKNSFWRRTSSLAMMAVFLLLLVTLSLGPWAFAPVNAQRPTPTNIGDTETPEPTEPTVEPTEPTVEPTEPTVEPTEPTVEPTEPTAEPTQDDDDDDDDDHDSGAQPQAEAELTSTPTATLQTVTVTSEMVNNAHLPTTGLGDMLGLYLAFLALVFAVVMFAVRRMRQHESEDNNSR